MNIIVISIFTTYIWKKSLFSVPSPGTRPSIIVALIIFIFRAWQSDARQIKKRLELHYYYVTINTWRSFSGENCKFTRNSLKKFNSIIVWMSENNINTRKKYIYTLREVLGYTFLENEMLNYDKILNYILLLLLYIFWVLLLWFAWRIEKIKLAMFTCHLLLVNYKAKKQTWYKTRKKTSDIATICEDKMPKCNQIYIFAQFDVSMNYSYVTSF